MPLQNRVLPDQTIAAIPLRGTLTGNRGILHDEGQRLIRRWTSKAWICCALDWKGRRRTPMTGRNWTELFFLDEAVALAAGHRPCATCRRQAFNAFKAAWAKAGLPGQTAPDIDAHLHATRLTPERHQRLHVADAASLPDFTFLRLGTPHLLLGGAVHPFTPEGYAPALPRPQGRVEVMTPAPMVAALQSGYLPLSHLPKYPTGGSGGT